MNGDNTSLGGNIQAIILYQNLLDRKKHRPKKFSRKLYH